MCLYFYWQIMFCLSGPYHDTFKKTSQFLIFCDQIMFQTKQMSFSHLFLFTLPKYSFDGVYFRYFISVSLSSPIHCKEMIQKNFENVNKLLLTVNKAYLLYTSEPSSSFVVEHTLKERLED